VGEFEGRVAFITGAAHGQGRATALALARKGADIVGYDIARQLAYPGYTMGTAGELQSLQAGVTDAGATCLTFEGDVRDSDAIAAAVTSTIEQLGRIDTLFNNAGICAYGLAHELTEDTWAAPRRDAHLFGVLTARIAVNLVSCMAASAQCDDAA
jgi:NAD(P)-dependent dehydrogenase (short-subunit alcohol dehydrogenase family)